MKVLDIFQFHKGTIRTIVMPKVLSCFNFYFNSIKVQLELIYMIGALIGAGLFQFHKGTIRTFVGWLETSAY